MKTIFLILILLFISPIARSKEVTYENIFNQKASSFGILGNGVRRFDLVSPAQKCPMSDKFICIVSEGFVFSVPRKNKYIRNWSHSNADYEVVFSKKMRMRGEEIQYRLIRQKWKGQILDYIHSDVYGILIIGNEGSQLSLNNRCGFAVVSNAKGCDPD